jgi:hypothetical protein
LMQLVELESSANCANFKAITTNFSWPLERVSVALEPDDLTRTSPR